MSKHARATEPTKITFCPICGNALKDGESLAARYIPEHSWWVLYHLKEDEENNKYSRKADFLKSWCGKARFTMKEFDTITVPC